MTHDRIISADAHVLVIAQTMAPLPAEDRAAVVAGNAARIFGLRSSQLLQEEAS
jgi:hypothetical protein